MDETMVYDFGMRMHWLREERGLSQAVLRRSRASARRRFTAMKITCKIRLWIGVKQLAVILHTSVHYLVGLDDAYTVKLPNMTDEQRTTLNEFIRVFVVK